MAATVASSSACTAGSAGELPVQSRRALVEELARGDRRALALLRIGEREDAEQEIFHRRELARLERGLPRLPEGGARAEDERSAGGGERGDGHPVAAHELDGAVEPNPRRARRSAGPSRCRRRSSASASAEA